LLLLLGFRGGIEIPMRFDQLKGFSGMRGVMSASHCV
jgi:hypothetical protein